ncbi:uncharacterized protein LOC116035797 [Sander lucioperca]|uniref:uncharacterized protein LOC116035797 n=1 Tax=Sander lucioperca TaxID=283035 RepID=UPI001653B581|nr:uncharacterized protein LOC116035797 [Sander lucioperca]
MASTTQSASDYVKNHRSRLVGKLKNLSVILENLSQENSDKKKVLSDEEVCEIEQAEKTDYNKTRKILDSVMKKGEAACYEFLRIIYMTRKRTLDPDLHYWISCFPFKEDPQMDTNYLQGSRPCHRYQEKLKSKAQKISDKFWMANKNQFKGNNKPDLSYMSLVLDTQGSVSPSKIKKSKNKKSKMSRKKKLRTYIPEVKADISPSDLLKTRQNILLVGKPGIGKTALAHEMLKLWAQRDNDVLDYMFYFDMRETSDIRKDTSLEDLLFSVFSEPDEGKEEVLQDIKQNSDNVTLIFDGVPDPSSSVVKRLVEKDLLPDAKVIVTCRQDDEEEFAFEDHLRVEVKGFSELTIKTYLSAMLGEEQKVMSNVELLTLCHVPMYALMVAVCFSSETPEDSPQPCTITEIYINIVRFCLQMNSNNISKRNLNCFINNKSKEILSLAEAAFHATEGKTVNLTERPCEDGCVLCFLKALFIEVAHTETKATYAFLHYTMQEFFAALWLLKNPEKIKEVFQQCLTEEKKHMKHLIPFMCRLLNEKSPSLMNCLIPAQELKNTSNWFFKEMITTFFNSGLDGDILFFCQCLYESQCPEACSHLLDKLGYHLDLSGESLDPYPCCAVAYVLTQSKERKISLNLEDVTVSEQGMTRLFGCLENVQWCDPLPEQLWRIFLLSEGQMDPISLLGLDGNRLHLPVEGKRQLYERAVKVVQKITMKVNVCLHWERKTPVCQSLCESLFEALPYISSFSFRKTYRGPGSQNQEQSHGTLEREEKQLLLDLCLKAAIHEGEHFHNVVNMLISLFSVSTDLHNILLDFYQHVKSEGFSVVIPKLRPLFQSAPAVWTINLSERKSSILLEVLKLQSEKKQVELRGCSDEESEVRSFLQCLPYISQLSCDPEFFQRVCSLISVRSREEAEQLASVLQLLGFSLLLTGELRRKTCRSVGTVVRLCGSDVNLILTPRKMSARGASLLFRRTTQLHSLKLSIDMALLMCRWVRRGTVACQLTIDELSLSSQTAQPSERVLWKVVSSLASLLRYWTVRRLDLTEFCVLAQGLIPLLLHDGPLTIKLSEKILQPLLSLLHEIQDEAFTGSFLRKVGGELTSCCLSWELLHYLLLQSSAHTITVNMRKNRFLQESVTRLLPFLDRIVFKRPSPSFVLTAIREIYKARASPVIPSLLRSLDDVINLTCREMDSEDFAALLFTLRHSDRVKLNLTWTFIPAREIKSILFMLDKVSHLSVDRNQLLRLVHCCAASEAQQGAAAGLLRTVQHRLDLSCCSSVEMDHQSDSFSLTAEDCRAVSTILTHSSRDTQLILQDCELEDSGLDLLFPVLHRVRLRASKAVLLRLVSLVPVNSERESVRRAVSLRTALDGQLDLSHSTLDQRACGALALMLDFSEELTELDLSHCGLTDQLLLTLSAQVLDLSHNNITDASTDMLLRLSINPSTDTVRLFGNNIVDRTSFKEDKRFEMW